MTAFQRATTMAKDMSAGAEVAASAMALPRSGPATPERDGKARNRLGGEEAGFPVRIGDGGDESLCRAGFGFEPLAGDVVDGVERGDFDQEVGVQVGSAPSTNSRLARGARKGRPRLAAPSVLAAGPSHGPAQSPARKRNSPALRSERESARGE